MPILANLSRRFHMLTTDAKPDPPKVPINGYTHNLTPNTKKEKSKDTNTESTSIGAEQSNATLPESKKSLPGDTSPNTNNNCSTTEQDASDTEIFANDAKPRKRANPKSKTKSKQHKYPAGPHVVNYNIINSTGVKIGSRTSYICNVNQYGNSKEDKSEEAWSKETVRPMPPEIESICTCTDQITIDHIFIIKNHIGRGWRDVARKLLYSEGQIQQFEENYRLRGIDEVIYQIFLDWTQANTRDAEIGKLINVLWSCKEYDCAERLTSAQNNTT